MRTSGPWECVHDKDGGFHIFAKMNDTGAEACIASRNEWPYHKNESKANGDLISAAPDLREALEELRNLFEMFGMLSFQDPEEGSTAWKVNHAIAKAKGETA